MPPPATIGPPNDNFFGTTAELRYVERIPELKTFRNRGENRSICQHYRVNWLRLTGGIWYHAMRSEKRNEWKKNESENAVVGLDCDLEYGGGLRWPRFVQGPSVLWLARSEQFGGLGTVCAGGVKCRKTSIDHIGDIDV